jgi:outer membrane protein OmpA-like peptidoglycan-associated protein
LCAHTDEITKPAVITKGQKNKLKSLAMLLNKSKNAQCMIVGHTDSIEHKRHPRLLGKSRAEFTKRALMKYKVNPEKIKITSHGLSRPIALNNTDEGRALNRRTEVIIN